MGEYYEICIKHSLINEFYVRITRTENFNSYLEMDVSKVKVVHLDMRKIAYPYLQHYIFLAKFQMLGIYQ